MACVLLCTLMFSDHLAPGEESLCFGFVLWGGASTPLCGLMMDPGWGGGSRLWEQTLGHHLQDFTLWPAQRAGAALEVSQHLVYLGHLGKREGTGPTLGGLCLCGPPRGLRHWTLWSPVHSTASVGVSPENRMHGLGGGASCRDFMEVMGKSA